MREKATYALFEEYGGNMMKKLWKVEKITEVMVVSLMMIIASMVGLWELLYECTNMTYDECMIFYVLVLIWWIWNTVRDTVIVVKNIIKA